MAGKKLRVGVLFGGKSSEHDVSLVSARSVMAALDASGFDVVPVGIDRSGRWIWGNDPMRVLTDGEHGSLRLTPGTQAAEHIDNNGVQAVTVATPLVPLAQILPAVDVVFPVLHGPMGEDGTVQGLLELADMPYVGCGVMASALAMDKLQCKAVFAAQGLPQVPYLAVLRRRWEQAHDTVLDQIEANLPYPLFVKPANMGSSIGVTKARDRVELATALDEAGRFDRKLVVEQGIDAREIEVSVLGNDEPLVSVPGEIVPGNEFYDYDAKYLLDTSELLIPAPIGAALTAQAQQLARAAFLALDGAGLARVDFLLERHSDRLYLNEVNTIPGFTQISMYPKLWEASGVSYPELVTRLVELALERHADRTRNLAVRGS